MFEIKFFVADKRVGDVLKVLQAYALDPPVATPYEQQPKNMAIAPRGGRATSEMIGEWLAREIKTGAKEITISNLRSFLQANGLNERSYSYAIAIAIQNKLIRKTKKIGTYEVIR